MIEANFDGLVGPTHNYAGLAHGNEASQKNASQASNPKAAALQGLAKMRLLHSLGVRQGVFPPQPRPALRYLASLGFMGSPREVMARVAASAPELLPFVYSSSGMWAANAATVTPSVDNADGKVHFTPANLTSTPHRALEAPFTARMMKAIFPEDAGFVHHAPLPAGPLTPDEGAANHMRLRPAGEEKNLHVFVYGRDMRGAAAPARYPARQTLQSSQSIARLHRLEVEQTLFVRQNPAAIDAGVFHNDVISTSHEHWLLYHENAFADGDATVREIQNKYGAEAWYITKISDAELSMPDAVSTYLFNSQVVSLTGGGMALIAPTECEEHKGVAELIDGWIRNSAHPLAQVHFMDLKQSMRNGGGPACLRLRVPLEEAEWQAAHRGVQFTDALYGKLVAWVEKHYRDRILPQDLADPQLADEAMAALDALTRILDMGALYDFQH